MKKVITLSISITILLFSTAQEVSKNKSDDKVYQIEYDMLKKQYTGTNTKRYYSQMRNYRISVIVNKLKYKVDGELSEVSYITPTPNALNKLFPDLDKGEVAPQDTLTKIIREPQSSPNVADGNKGKPQTVTYSPSNEEVKIIGEFYAKHDMLNANYHKLKVSIDGLKNNYIQLVKLLANDRKNEDTKIENLKLNKIEVDDIKASVINQLSDGQSFLSYINLNEHILNRYIKEYAKATPLQAYYSNTKLQDSLLRSVDVDSIYWLTNNLAQQLLNSENYTYYFPEFSTNAEEIEPLLRYKLQSATENTPYTELKLPKLRLANFLRLGFGSGPVAVYTPGIKSYYKREFTTIDTVNGNTDSILIYSKDVRNRLSFSLAAFADLDYQITPITSLGMGIGAGLNLGETITGNLYTGINLGFRVANKAQVALRCGLAFSQHKVLKDEYDESANYLKTEISDSEITQQKWMPGFFMGFSISYLTKSISKK